MKSWSVYLLECADGSYYTGITNDLEKRMMAHRSGKGSKYVLAKGFKKIISTKSYDSRSKALKAEYKIKQLSRKIKLEFFNNESI